MKTDVFSFSKPWFSCKSREFLLCSSLHTWPWPLKQTPNYWAETTLDIRRQAYRWNVQNLQILEQTVSNGQCNSYKKVWKSQPTSETMLWLAEIIKGRQAKAFHSVLIDYFESSYKKWCSKWYLWRLTTPKPCTVPASLVAEIFLSLRNVGWCSVCSISVGTCGLW